MSPSTILKRNGEAVPFDREKITVAIYKAMAAGGRHDRELAERLCAEVTSALDAAYSNDKLPTVEDTQDFVEQVLIRGGHAETAKRYILYRSERAKLRSARRRERLEHIPYKEMWQALDWAVEHGCNTVAGLNEIIRQGRLPWLIEEADQLYDRRPAAASCSASLRVVVDLPELDGPATMMKRSSSRRSRIASAIWPSFLS